MTPRWSISRRKVRPKAAPKTQRPKRASAELWRTCQVRRPPSSASTRSSARALPRMRCAAHSCLGTACDRPRPRRRLAGTTATFASCAAQVFEEVGETSLRALRQGFNSTVLAYGQALRRRFEPQRPRSARCDARPAPLSHPAHLEPLSSRRRVPASPSRWRAPPITRVWCRASSNAPLSSSAAMPTSRASRSRCSSSSCTTSSCRHARARPHAHSGG